MSLLPWQTAQIKEVVQRTENTRSFFLELQGADMFDFIAGQFVTLDLPIHERQSKRMRSYSIASAPDGTNIFELIVSHLPNGTGSTYLFEKGQPGLEIKFRGPQGNFILPAEAQRDICMICTGTGVAPFRAQLNYIAAHHIKIPQIYLIFGSRFIDDILYYEELKQLVDVLDSFNYEVTLSRESSPLWGGRRGYVHPIYEEISRHGKRDMDFYVCGWQAMVDEAQRNLENMGYHHDRIHLELYG